jgi:glycosyltransferase involved in cell wall biosynthesis
MTGISVIVCCYNSAQRLPQTLKHLALQQVPTDFSWEVIVVDNASTDNTARIAVQQWQQYQIQGAGFKVISEKQPGKNHAFKTGIYAALYDYVLTCDDDNWLFSDYIVKAFNTMQADETIGALGGCGIFEPEQPVNPQIEAYKNSYVNGPQTQAETHHWVYGAGSVYQKAIITNLFNSGWTFVTPGRVGGKLNGGEDVEMCFMIYLSGFKITADNSLLFKHFVPLQRQTLKYVTDLTFWQAYTNVMLFGYYAIINKDKRPVSKVLNSWFWGTFKSVVKQRLIIFYKKLTGKISSIEEKRAVKGLLGTFYALLKRNNIVEHYYHTKSLFSPASH